MTRRPNAIPRFRYTRIHRGKYKWELTADLMVQTRVHPAADVEHEYFTLAPDGRMLIRAGYAWDGGSGPAIDSLSMLYASVVHDALYQALRVGLLPESARIEADRTFRDLLWWAGRHLARHGEPSLVAPRLALAWARSRWCYVAVRLCGRRHTLPTP